MTKGTAFPNWDEIHPACRPQFMGLADDLSAAFANRQTTTLFRPFELYRSPAEQLDAYRRKTSKALPWESAHQMGMAVDFVPFVNGRWTWEGDFDWMILHRLAGARGLVHGIPWDKAHVESPKFRQVRSLLWAPNPVTTENAATESERPKAA